MSEILVESRELPDGRSQPEPRPWFGPLVCVFMLSVLYFVNIMLRASDKCFWVDELVTVYLCRLPNLHSITIANQHATDFNPPLFYIMTQGAQHFFGDGLIATRLPEILGLYCFCIGLYLFVARRLGHLSGFVAGVFPFFTAAQYYAYEARPHGITLGWCGCALLAWQVAKSGQRKWIAAAAFFGCLVGAFLTHVYAIIIVIPFAVAELYEGWRNRRLDWRIVAVVSAALAVGAAFDLPLLHSYVQGAPQHGPGRLSWAVIEPFTKSLLGSGTVVMVLVLAIVGASMKAGGVTKNVRETLPEREVVLALAFACLPLIGIQVVRLTNGPFYYRYFLASIAGFSILLGAACSVAARRIPHSQGVIASFLAIALLYDTQNVIRHHLHHATLGATEPTSGFVIGSPDAPLARNAALLALRDHEDVLVLQQLAEMYLYEYAPPDLKTHLYLAAPTADDPMLTVYDRVATWAHVGLRTTSFDPFLAKHSHFYVYGSTREDSVLPSCGNCVQYFITAGYRLESVQRDPDGLLFKYAK